MNGGIPAGPGAKRSGSPGRHRAIAGMVSEPPPSHHQLYTSARPALRRSARQDASEMGFLRWDMAPHGAIFDWSRYGGQRPRGLGCRGDRAGGGSAAIIGERRRPRSPNQLPASLHTADSSSTHSWPPSQQMMRPLLFLIAIASGAVGGGSVMLTTDCLTAQVTVVRKSNCAGWAMHLVPLPLRCPAMSS